ncbi:MAG: uncharacterized protein PWP48_1781 [Clostridiales bacterium]|jgi:hypothetical protein|nr:uncharacterized protein [Clostridiales bacterium]MDK2992548.1 uncharacterized protein [Clostridiales bacterium]
MRQVNFVSPTKGRMDLDALCDDIMEYVISDEESDYRLMIGTDSQVHADVCFVTAIIIYREGKGGRYFYRRFYQARIPSFKQRIFMEANYSLEVANLIMEMLDARGLGSLNVEIHLDVGKNGKTREIIKEVVSMITGCGICAQIKPDSVGASSVADRYTKAM